MLHLRPPVALALLTPGFGSIAFRMHIKRFATALTGASLLLVAACSGGGASVDLPRTPAVSAMKLDNDGFSFANFSAKKTTEEFDSSDLVAMFGLTPEVCTGGTEPCTPTPEAAAFARMVNQARASGHCEGLVALAASRFIEQVSPPTGNLDNDGDVVHAIFRAFATQFLPESQKETNEWAKRPIEAVLKALQDELAANKLAYTLNLYTDKGGHAVLPVAIEFPDNDTAIVRVYDSNWPGRDRYVTFNLADKSWSFSFSGANPANDPNMWTGGEGDVDLTSLSSRTTSSCPFCGDGAAVRNTLLVIRSVDEKISITTDEGTVSPGTPTAGETTIKPLAGPGAAPGEGQPRDYIVSIPATNKSTKVNAKTEARIVAITPKAISEAKTPPGGSASPIEFTPSQVSVIDPAIEITLTAGDFAVTSSGENNSISTDGNGVTVTVDDSSGAPATVETSTDQPAIEVAGAGSSDLPDGAAYVVKAQSSGSRLAVTVVAPDGSSSTTETAGTLSNTAVTPDLSDPLAPTDEVPGLPPESERLETTTGSTTTVPGGTPADPNDPRTPTTRPRSSSTTSPRSTARTAITVGINLDEWSFGANDPASSGFDSSLALTGTSTQRCSTAVCLEGMFAEGTASGTDAATGRTVTTTATFTMSAVSVPFAVRCGNSGSWVTAAASQGLYSASCSISSVTQDETIFIRS